MTQKILYNLFQIIIILGNISVLCGAVRVMKMLLLLFKRTDHTYFNVLLCKLFRGRKKYLFVFWTCFVLFIVTHLLSIFGLIRSLGTYMSTYEMWLIGTQNTAIVASSLLFLRLIFIRIKYEYKLHKL